MKVRILRDVVNPSGYLAAGAIRDVPCAEARELIRAGLAESLTDSAASTATTSRDPDSETASLKHKPPKRRKAKRRTSS